MNALTPIAVTGESLLRAIQAGSFTSLTDLAVQAEREPKNIARDLTRLEEAGLIDRSAANKPALTTSGLEQLAAIDRANAPVVLHDQIERDPFNPREVFDEEFIAGLAESIFDDGRLTLLQPLVIRPREGGDKPFRLVAGEQRWRAIGLLIADGRWPADLAVPTRIMVLTDEQAEVLALIENVQRENLNPIDEAKRYRHFREKRNWSTAQIAKAANKSQKHVQNLLRCLELPEDVQALMKLPKGDERRVGARQARHLFQQHQEAPPVLELSPALGLALLELADKAQAFPATHMGEPGFTQITHWPSVGPLYALNQRKVVTFKNSGKETFAKILGHTSGALTWLEARGFFQDPASAIAAAAGDVEHLPVKPEQVAYYTRELNIAIVEAAATPKVTHTVIGQPEITIPATPAQVMALAEISATIEPDLGRHRSHHSSAPVHHAVMDHAVCKELLLAGLLTIQSPYEYGSHHNKVSLSQRGIKALDEHLPVFTFGRTEENRYGALLLARDKARLAGVDIEALQAELSAFFAEPIELPPEGKEYAQRVADRERERQARAERMAAEKAEQEAKAKEDEERGREFLIDIRAFEAIAPDMTHEQFATVFRDLLNTYGLRGPFEIGLHNRLPALQGEGGPLVASGAMFEGLRRIQAIALNHAIGEADVYSGDELPDPNAPPVGEEAPGDTTDYEPETEEEFWRIVGETFAGRYGATEARAAELVQLAMKRLTDSDQSYGDGSSEWDRLEAQAVATGYVEDFPDCIAPPPADTESEGGE